MDEAAFRHVTDHLMAVGGTDVLMIDGRMYQLTAEQLSEKAPEAVRQFLEGQDDADIAPDAEPPSA